MTERDYEADAWACIHPLDLAPDDCASLGDAAKRVAAALQEAEERGVRRVLRAVEEVCVVAYKGEVETIEEMQRHVRMHLTTAFAAGVLDRMEQIHDVNKMAQMYQRELESIGKSRDQIREQYGLTPLGGVTSTLGVSMDPSCSHGVHFDEVAARGLSVLEVRKRWPRLWGPCPLGCGYSGIGYASAAHFVAGDW